MELSRGRAIPLPDLLDTDARHNSRPLDLSIYSSALPARFLMISCAIGCGLLPLAHHEAY